VTVIRRTADHSIGVHGDTHVSHSEVQSKAVATSTHLTLEQLLLKSDFGRLEPGRVRELVRASRQAGSKSGD
jgi:hypothetical protein